MFDYTKLFVKMAENKLQKTDLTKRGINQSAVTRLAKGQTVSMSTLDRLCEIFQCQPSDIMDWKPNEERDESEK